MDKIVCYLATVLQYWPYMAAYIAIFTLANKRVVIPGIGLKEDK
jgi:hypothetical protein